ncbi:GlcG/HbpS family heme-binding protein [Companilactobacillus furfuricola]|uniref:GlcG/HbpS family heme-binding protein n=1 Tax=Companilactobacillus furfuricola TaxID=1462575 RepID=UPI000F77E87F|nr:heme-binding protein [Companilactobacillus furfuricola]
MTPENLFVNVQSAIKNSDGTSAFSRQNLQKALDAGEKKANEIKVGVTMCITDAYAQPILTYHMPNANMVSLELAPKKAWSAVAMKMPSKEISAQIQPGAPLYQMGGMLDGKLASFAGGNPIIVNNQIVGSVGVSGGAVEEDQAVSLAIVNYIKEGLK